MTDTKHTPGPWKVSLGITEYETICTLCPTPSWKPMRIDGPRPILSDETEHNARMIAAAPETAAERDKLKAINAELLEALEFALKALYAPDCPAIPDGAMVKGKIYSAISKAKGE